MSRGPPAVAFLCSSTFKEGMRLGVRCVITTLLSRCSWIVRSNAATVTPCTATQTSGIPGTCRREARVLQSHKALAVHDTLRHPAKPIDQLVCPTHANSVLICSCHLPLSRAKCLTMVICKILVWHVNKDILLAILQQQEDTLLARCNEISPEEGSL